MEVVLDAGRVGALDQPRLGGAAFDREVDAVHVEDLAVDRAVGPVVGLEEERQIDHTIHSGQRHRGQRAQRGRDAGRVGGAADHVEAEDLPRHGVGEDDLGTQRVLREVDDDVGALGRGEDELVLFESGGEQASVGADAGELVAGQLEVEDALVGGVDEPEPVLAGGDLEVGLWNTVGEHHRALGRIVEDHDVAAVVELDVAQEDRDVVGAGRQVQRAFGVVLDHVGAVQSQIDVRGLGAVTVVVVPEGRALLGVRVEVEAGAAGFDDVLGVAVVLGRHVAAVQVDVGRLVQLVVEHDQGLAAGLRPDRRAHELTSEAHHRRLQAGQDLRGRSFDRKLVDLLFRRGHQRFEHGRHGHRACPRHYLRFHTREGLGLLERVPAVRGVFVTLGRRREQSRHTEHACRDSSRGEHTSSVEHRCSPKRPRRRRA